MVMLQPAHADDDGILSALCSIHKILHFMLPFFGSCLFVEAKKTKSFIDKTPPKEERQLNFFVAAIVLRKKELLHPLFRPC